MYTPNLFLTCSTSTLSLWWSGTNVAYFPNTLEILHTGAISQMKLLSQQLHVKDENATSVFCCWWCDGIEPAKRLSSSRESERRMDAQKAEWGKETKGDMVNQMLHETSKILMVKEMHHQSFSECFFPERINVTYMYAVYGRIIFFYAKAKKTINFLFRLLWYSSFEAKETADVFLGTACFKNYRGFLGLSAFFLLTIPSPAAAQHLPNNGKKDYTWTKLTSILDTIVVGGAQHFFFTLHIGAKYPILVANMSLNLFTNCVILGENLWFPSLDLRLTCISKKIIGNSGLLRHPLLWWTLHRLWSQVSSSQWIQVATFISFYSRKSCYYIFFFLLSDDNGYIANTIYISFV